MTQLTINRHPIIRNHNDKLIKIERQNLSLRTDNFEDYFYYKLFPILKNNKKLERDVKKYQKYTAKTIFLNSLDSGFTEEEAIMISADLINSHKFLLPYSQKIQKNRLKGDRTAVRFLKNVQYLYTCTELRPFWENQLDVIKHKLSQYPLMRDDPDMSVPVRRYLNIVWKNTLDFIFQYERVIDDYRYSITQTEFKLQLLVGSDAAKEVLSYV